MISQNFYPKPRVITQKFYIMPKNGLPPRQVSSKVFYQCLAVAKNICGLKEYKEYNYPVSFPCPIYFCSDLFDGVAIVLEDNLWSTTTRIMMHEHGYPVV